jgi:hypothetical protein
VLAVFIIRVEMGRACNIHGKNNEGLYKIPFKYLAKKTNLEIPRIMLKI